LQRLIKRMFQTTVLVICAFYAFLIVYAYIPSEVIPLDELRSPDDKFFRHFEHQVRYQTLSEFSSENPNLILIHGFGNSLGTWDSLGSRLNKAYNVYSIDMIGFGLSEKPVDYKYTNLNQASIIESFAKAMDMESFIVGGHSLGGAVAMHVAINNEKTQGLILFNPGIINTGVPEFSKYLNLIFPMSRVSAKQFANRDFREGFLKQSYYDPSIVTEKVMDRVILGSQTKDYMSGMSSMLSKTYNSNEAELMNKVKLPTLIVFGIEDRNKSMEEAEELRDGFTNSRLEIIQNAGHYVHEESPVSVSQIIIKSVEFLTSKNE
jgi:pimeloyl-ACP methyl ester carboxylesterase